MCCIHARVGSGTENTCACRRPCKQLQGMQPRPDVPPCMLKKAQVRPKEDTTSVFLKPFGAETIKLNPNRLLEPMQIWLACWACCLSYSWGNSGAALRKQGSQDADKQTKDEQEALLFFLPLACSWNKLYVCNRVSVKQHCFWHIVVRKMLNVCSMASTNPYADKKERFR